jgi:hypothetical protein
MTEREDIIEQIEFLHWRKAILTCKAGLAERAGDPELADHYDAEWNKASNEVGRLQARLAAGWGADDDRILREQIADAAYGRP